MRMIHVSPEALTAIDSGNTARTWLCNIGIDCMCDNGKIAIKVNNLLPYWNVLKKYPSLKSIDTALATEDT